MLANNYVSDGSCFNFCGSSTGCDVVYTTETVNGLWNTTKVFDDYVDFEKGNNMSKRRVVSIYAVDKNDNVPTEKALVYKQDGLFTDFTDQELLIEIDLKKILTEYNVFRISCRDREYKDREVNLEPARISDLSISIVEICKF